MFECNTCHKSWTIVFMIKDELWEFGGMTGWVCIPCFETSIGRKINIEDLDPDAPCNHILPLGWIIGDRHFGKWK